MNREQIDQWCERGILWVTLAILVLLPLAFGGRPQPAANSFLDPILVDPFSIAQWLTIPVMAMWGIRLWANPRSRLLWPPICWAVVAFVVYAVIRYSQAEIEYVARQELIRIIVYACLFFAILNNLHRQEFTQTIAYTLIFLGMVISMFALYQFLSGSNRVWHVFKPYAHRASGTYISPNHLGGFLEMIAPLGLAYTVLGRSKPLMKVFLGYASIVMLVGIGVTISRGSWISTGLVMLLFLGVLMFRPGFRIPSLVLLVLILGGGAVFYVKSFSLQLRFKQLVSQGKLDDDMRFALWEPAVKVWQENIWWGGGPDHFEQRFFAYRPLDVQGRPDRVHNDYLNTLADWGIAGAALVASAWLLLGLGVWKTWRFVRKPPTDLGNKRGSGKHAFVLGSGLGLLAILLHSVVDFNMHIPANAIVAVTLIALLSSHLRFATERFWFTPPAWIKAPLTACILVAAVYLAMQGGRRAAENYWLTKAHRLPDLWPVQTELYRKAFAVEPMNAMTAWNIGEALRTESAEGDITESAEGDGNYDKKAKAYEKKAEEAMQWFSRVMKLNPLSALGFLGYGRCLDWLDRQSESGSYFSRAEELDPNGYATVAFIGLHYAQMGDYAAAKPWFERSLRLQTKKNTLAEAYLQVCLTRLQEAGSAQKGPQLPASVSK